MPRGGGRAHEAFGDGPVAPHVVGHVSAAEDDAAQCRRVGDATDGDPRAGDC
jgi:hypothetical protein